MKILLGTALAITALLLPVPKEVQSDAGGPQAIIDRDSATYFYSLGQAEETSRRPNSAWHYYERASYYNPQDPAILERIIGVTAKLNKSQATLAAMEKLQGLQPSNHDGARSLAEAYYYRGNWAKAVGWGKQAEKLSANAPGLQYMLGVSHYNQRDYSAALPYLRRAVQTEPDRADAHYYLGRIYIQQGQYARSLPHYERTLSLDATKPMRAYEYALALSTAGQPEKSVEWFSKALEMGYEARDDFYTNMAYTLADAKQTRQAITTLKSVLQRRPDDQNILYALGEMNYTAGQYKEAIRYWDDVLKLDKENARALFMIGKSYLAMGKTSEGQQLCNKAIEMDPSLSGLRQKRGI